MKLRGLRREGKIFFMMGWIFLKSMDFLRGDEMVELEKKVLGGKPFIDAKVGEVDIFHLNQEMMDKIDLKVIGYLLDNNRRYMVMEDKIVQEGRTFGMKVGGDMEVQLKCEKVLENKCIVSLEGNMYTVEYIWMKN